MVRTEAEVRREVDKRIAMGKAALPLLDRTQSLLEIERGLRIVPTGDVNKGWEVLPVDAPEDPDPDPRPIDSAWRALLDAQRTGDADAFALASVNLVAAQRSIRPRAMPSMTVLDLEILYNRIMPLHLAFVVFLLGSALFTIHMFVRNGITGGFALGGLVLGILVNTYIIAMFTLFAGRLPLRNLPEVWLVVAWFLPVIALFLQVLLRNGIYGCIGVVMTCGAYAVAAFAFDPKGFEIRPLVAILNSGWREVHILSIILSYAILFVACGIHVSYIIARFVDGWARSAGPISLTLDRQAYHVVAWGFLFLGTGIATGAAWGNDAWGRYWGWDSKEVWATVAWVIYGILMHVRAFFRVRGLPLALLNILGFAAVLFTYLGVTYLLTGLHSYGSS